MKNIIKNSKYVLSVILVITFVFSSFNVFAIEKITQPNTEPVKSMVKNITVKGGAFTTGFKPGNFIYSVYLKSFQENLNISVMLNDTRFEYTINGEKLLAREKDNVVIINVTDPEGEYSDEKYTLNIFFNTMGLTYLDVENGIFSPQFDKFHTTYYAILENNIDSFESAGVNWKTANKDAVVEVVCSDELNEDGTLPEGEKTEYKIMVYEQDGTSKNYKLMLYRKASTITALDERALLSNIKINGGAVDSLKFKQKRSFYDVIIPNSIKELDIQAYPADRSNTVEIIGNTVMNEAEPICITIVVNSSKYGTNSYYTLRCRYDNAMYTEKHTDLKLASYVLMAVFAGFVIGFSVAMIFRHKQNKKKEYFTDSSLNEGTILEKEEATVAKADSQK